MKSIFYFAIGTLLFYGSNLRAQKFSADVEKSTVTWHAKKVTGEHVGSVKIKSGEFELKKNLPIQGRFVIDMQSIVDSDLQNPAMKSKLETHLKSPDFFDVAKYPEAVIQFAKGTVFTNGISKVEANLTIKGITKPISFDIQKDGNAYVATLEVDRTLYDIRYGSGKFFENLGDKMIYDTFTISVRIVVNKN